MIDLDNQQQIAEFIRDNIDSHKLFALATVGLEGKPWAVCLNLAYDEKFNIIWKSEKNTVHSGYVKQNPGVAICIFSEDPHRGDFGLYISATAREVTDKDELNRLLQVRFAKKGKPLPPASDFTGNSSSRIYYAETEDMYFNDSRHAKTKVDLLVLRDVISQNWVEL